MELSKKRLFLLDMDGTIYIDETLFDGTIDFLNHVKSIGGRYVFLTNNSSKGVDTYIEKMKRMGIDTTKDDFLTSTDATIDYLKKNGLQDKSYYICGTESLKKQFSDFGFNLVDTVFSDAANENVNSIDVLLLGYDTELNYKKIEDCCKLLFRKDNPVMYIATHPDLVCPTAYGCAPDCGSVIEMLKTATGKEPLVIGKPKPEMVYLALEKYGFTKDETCIIGDRLYTDISCGVNAGIDSIFVLSGEGTMPDIDKFGVKPSYIFKNIREVLNNIKE
ncbi:MAG: HAD-IIA family hydrolase [Bacillota bacterium]|nr:HAD-IIA family hydrolase [Bacillota bacterium]